MLLFNSGVLHKMQSFVCTDNEKMKQEKLLSYNSNLCPPSINEWTHQNPRWNDQRWLQDWEWRHLPVTQPEVKLSVSGPDYKLTSDSGSYFMSEFRGRMMNTPTHRAAALLRNESWWKTQRTNRTRQDRNVQNEAAGLKGILWECVSLLLPTIWQQLQSQPTSTFSCSIIFCSV